jgi:hypothetical protein
VQFDLIRVIAQPLLASIVEPVTWTVVDDHEDLAGRVALDHGQQELVEGMPVEDVSKLVDERGTFYCDCSEHMGGLAQTEGRHAWLDADW